jgi:hypothetical protein
MTSPTEIERADDVLRPGSVKSVSEEPEGVTIQRLRNERTAYVLVVSIAAAIFALLLVFMMLVYLSGGTSEDAKGKIIAGLIAAVSATLGVLAGQKL